MLIDLRINEFNTDTVFYGWVFFFFRVYLCSGSRFFLLNYAFLTAIDKKN